MPKFLEEKLKSFAKKKGMSSKEAKHYAFGAMNNMGAMKGSKITKKGEAMEEMHESAAEEAAEQVKTSSRLKKIGKKFSKKNGS